MVRICIDPGHGGRDSGAKWESVLEKDINLDISLKLSSILREFGVEVVLTRTSDVDVVVKQRLLIANGQPFNVVISIHNNSAQNEQANGSEVIYPYNNEEMQRLSQIILDRLGELGLNKRRVYYRLNNNSQDYYYIIRETIYPAIIVEGAFISNEGDRRLLVQPEFRTRMAEKIAQGIVEHYGLAKKQPSHWAQQYFDQVREMGLVINDHDLNAPVTWGEFSTVITRLIKYIKE